MAATQVGQPLALADTTALSSSSNMTTASEHWLPVIMTVLAPLDLGSCITQPVCHLLRCYQSFTLSTLHPTLLPPTTAAHQRRSYHSSSLSVPAAAGPAAATLRSSFVIVLRMPPWHLLLVMQWVSSLSHTGVFASEYPWSSGSCMAHDKQVWQQSGQGVCRYMQQPLPHHVPVL